MKCFPTGCPTDSISCFSHGPDPYDAAPNERRWLRPYKLIHQDVEIESFHSFPVFSADGQRVERVVLLSDRDQDDEDEIYLANADGSGLTQLTIDDSYQGGRDERPVVFSTTIYDGNGDDEIYIMNPDGSGLVRLTDNTSRDFAPHLALPHKHLSRDTLPP